MIVQSKNNHEFITAIYFLLDRTNKVKAGLFDSVTHLFTKQLCPNEGSLMIPNNKIILHQGPTGVLKIFLLMLLTNSNSQNDIKELS
jgi:hypothetical protein